MPPAFPAAVPQPVPPPATTTTMSDPAAPTPDDSAGSAGLEAARRDKLRKIQELGHDPWGGRFDDRQLIADIRSKAAEIVYQTNDGQDDTAAAGGRH